MSPRSATRIKLGVVPTRRGWHVLLTLSSAMPSVLCRERAPDLPTTSSCRLPAVRHVYGHREARRDRAPVVRVSLLSDAQLERRAILDQVGRGAEDSVGDRDQHRGPLR